MGVLQDTFTDDIKAPSFDRPEGAAPGGLQIGGGSRVILGYRGQRVTVRVEAVERLGTAFVGRVQSLDPGEPRPIDLGPGDSVRFRLRDVLAIA